MSSGEKKLEEKVALITGGSSGIGVAIAKAFAKEGARLSLSGRNEDDLKRVKKECEDLGTKVVYTAGDISCAEVRKNIVMNTVEKFGRIDLLINNAGVLRYTTIADGNLDDYDYMLDINTRAAYHMTSLCIPHLKKSKGNVVNVSSVLADIAFSASTAYSMSKAALDSFTRCAAIEFAPFSIRVNSVNPGITVPTKIFREVKMSPEEAKEVLKVIASIHAQKRSGTPEEIANVVLFLASEDSSFMTGSILAVDGGLTPYKKELSGN